MDKNPKENKKVPELIQVKTPVSFVQLMGNGKFCNHCGAPLGTQRCPNCGAEVALGLKFCGECGSSMEKSGKCPSCGFENDPGMKFCGNCGSKL